MGTREEETARGGASSRPGVAWPGVHAVLVGVMLWLLAAASTASTPPLQGVMRVEAGDVQGSGFIVRIAAEGAYVVTAAHVVKGVKRPRVALADAPSAWIDAETLRLDALDADGLAVLLVPASSLQGRRAQKLPLSAAPASPADDVLVVGFPRVMAGLSMLPGRVTLRPSNLVFSQALPEGFSGSPMLVDGRVVGVVTSTLRDNGLGVPVGVVREFLRGASVRLAPQMAAAFVREWGREGSGAGEFLRPWGIAAAWSTDRVYVLDSFRNDVQVFSRTGRLLERLAVPVRGDFLAADSNGLLHVLNSDTRGRGNRVEVFAPGAATPRRSFPIAAASPRAIDTDIYGRDIYVTDIKGQRVLRYDEHGALSAQWGGPGSGPAQFRDPWGVAVDRYRTRRIYVADTGNDRVQAFTRDGRLLATWGEKGSADGQFDSPIDIAVDTSHGYVYVLDRNNTRVQVFTPDGEFLGKWGAPGAGPGEFVDPYGIDIDGEGTVYVLDTGNRRVQVFRLQWE